MRQVKQLEKEATRFIDPPLNLKVLASSSATEKTVNLHI